MSIRWILGNKYSINRESARSGGTATVYRALDLDSAVSVAIKMFDRGAMASDLTKEAYQRELKCLSELNSHPNIAKLLDFGEEANTGNPFIVMEWLEKSLLDVIAENAIKNWDHFYDHYGKPLLEALS
jgi:serine/threonine protein kinase